MRSSSHIPPFDKRTLMEFGLMGLDILLTTANTVMRTKPKQFFGK